MGFHCLGTKPLLCFSGVPGASQAQPPQEDMIGWAEDVLGC